MRSIKKILNFFKFPIDIVISLLIIPSSIVMLIFRKIGGHKLFLSKSILKKVGIFPLTSNYYEPSFNFDNLKKNLSEKRNLPGINFNIENQIKNLKQLDYKKELENLNLKNNSPNFNFNIDNNFFEAGDAEIYYQMIRYHKPKKIIEIGSGQSSLIAMEAINNNKQIDNFITELTCIEPFENKWLEKNDIRVIRKKVEEIDTDIFTDLNKGDILFIDSSHVIKPQGDIVKIFLEILPKLKSGVIIHIHDIFSPRDYLENWLKIENRFFNEQYLLEGMLDNSSRYKIMLSLNLLKYDFYKELKNVCPYLNDRSEPSSFYMTIN
tara:strand:- start:279 stop:1244 length:966 start_codon:yes stop_codon:yes gene_type:complete